MESITVFTKTDEQHSVCSKREHPDEDLAVLTLCKPLMFSQGIDIDSKGLHFSTINTLLAVGPVCLPEPVQEKLARLPTSISSTTICNEDRDGSPLAVMGGDGRYTQMGVGCTKLGDSWFYIKYRSLKSWINLSTSTPSSTTPPTTTSRPASTTPAPSTKGFNVYVIILKLILNKSNQIYGIFLFRHRVSSF